MDLYWKIENAVDQRLSELSSSIISGRGDFSISSRAISSGVEISDIDCFQDEIYGCSPEEFRYIFLSCFSIIWMQQEQAKESQGVFTFSCVPLWKDNDILSALDDDLELIARIYRFFWELQIFTYSKRELRAFKKYKRGNWPGN